VNVVSNVRHGRSKKNLTQKNFFRKIFANKKNVITFRIVLTKIKKRYGKISEESSKEVCKKDD